VYVSFSFRVWGLGFIDAVFYSSNDPATSAPYYAEGFHRLKNRGSSYASIVYFDGNNEFNLSHVYFDRIRRGIWHDFLTSARNDATGWLAVFNATNLEASAYDTSTNVTAVGVGANYTRFAIIRGTRQPYTVHFDRLLVTVGHPPYYVNVTGLQAGWYVVIRDSQGNVRGG